MNSKRSRETFFRQKYVSKMQTPYAYIERWDLVHECNSIRPCFVTFFCNFALWSHASPIFLTEIGVHPYYSHFAFIFQHKWRVIIFSCLTPMLPVIKKSVAQHLWVIICPANKCSNKALLKCMENIKSIKIYCVSLRHESGQITKTRRQRQKCRGH